jgi:hypothetical protein
MLESDIQSRTRVRVLDWALNNNIGLMFLKLGQSKGWPDMMVVWECGGVLFVEFKRPGEKPRRIQEHVHKLLRSLGFEVQVHDNIDTAVEQITGYIKTKAGARTWR